jgi:transposase
MLTAIYFMIRDNTEYRDLGRDYFQRRDRSKSARRFVAQLQRLGYNVQITEAVA